MSWGSKTGEARTVLLRSMRANLMGSIGGWISDNTWRLSLRSSRIEVRVLRIAIARRYPSTLRSMR